MRDEGCEECGAFVPHSRSRFCSDKCRYRARDRARYAADPEAEREKGRRYYAANREKKLASAKERQRQVVMARKETVAGGAKWLGGLKYCSCGTLIANPRHWHCTRCRELRRRHRQREKEVRRRRATPTERGYGTAHKQLRKKWEPIVATGLVRCARCNLPIRAGMRWDLGHDDNDRTKYTGPEHIRCNRATAGRSQRPSA